MRLRAGLRLWHRLLRERAPVRGTKILLRLQKLCTDLPMYRSVRQRLLSGKWLRKLLRTGVRLRLRQLLRTNLWYWMRLMLRTLLQPFMLPEALRLLQLLWSHRERALLLRPLRRLQRRDVLERVA